MAATSNITIDQGATFVKAYRWKVDGVAVDLTGYTAKMQVRKKASATSEVLLEASSANGRVTITALEGRVAIKIPDEITAALDFSEAVWDLELTSPAGDVKRLVQGTVTLDKEVTR